MPTKGPSSLCFAEAGERRGTRDEAGGTRDGDGMTIFNNAVKYVRENF